MLKEKAEEILEALEVEYNDGNGIENSEHFQIFIQESVDSACIYTSDCWEMAQEADNLTDYDSGLWEGTKDINKMIARIAYAALEQEVYDILLDKKGRFVDLRKAYLSN